MTDTAVAVAQGIGNETTTFQMLIQLVRQVSEMGATLKSVDAGLTEVRTNTAHQLAALQERVGKSEAMNEVQNERIKQGEQSEIALRADIREAEAAHVKEIGDLKTEHAKAIAALKADHAREILELRAEMKEANQQRWMIRGGLAILAVMWPIVWQLGILPLFGR